MLLRLETEGKNELEPAEPAAQQDCSILESCVSPQGMLSIFCGLNVLVY